jgi:hypothetical protein
MANSEQINHEMHNTRAVAQSPRAALGFPSGGCFAKASESLLASAFSKTAPEFASELALCFLFPSFYLVSIREFRGASKL